MAAATKQNAVEAKPFSPIPSPAAVPNSLPVSGLGEKPINSAINVIMTPALTGYEIAVVAQTMTEKP